MKKLTLSDAILKGCKMRPEQAFGEYYDGQDCSALERFIRAACAYNRALEEHDIALEEFNVSAEEYDTLVAKGQKND